MAARQTRIFQIAKDLNISHSEILTFLKGKGIEVASLMSSVDKETQDMIQVEFHKEREDIERFRKEQVRREIHQTRIDEQQKAQKKLNLLSLDEQRALEKLEKQEQKKAEQKAKEKIVLEERKKAEQVEQKKQAEKENKQKKSAKSKLRKIDLTEIKAQIGTVTRKPPVKKQVEPATRSAKDAVKQTLARMDKKTRKKVYKKERKQEAEEIIAEEDVQKIRIPEYSSVDELAKIMEVDPSDIIQECISLGKLATINQRLDWDIIEMLAETFGYQAVAVKDVAEELFTLDESEEDLEKAIPRAPVVTIMGHVDHGKTSLLDYIRDANVVAGESGGITQHMGAYQVDLPKEGKRITFLDTPGHEAFTAMRARGAQVTDIVVLMVAANDGVMPQTIEAISHAKAAGVPLVVAINKMDLPDIDPERVKRELSENEVLLEDWGGKVQGVEISAKEGTGVDDLLQSILVEAEILELKANKDTLARGTVIDSKLDKGHGPMATVLIQKGTLKVGDPFICNNYAGRVRAIMDERGHRIQEALPSEAVQILGFDQVPQAADIFSVVDDARDLKRLAADRQRTKREIDQRKITATTLDSISAKMKEGSMKTLPLVIKGDADGSIEALSETLEKIKNEEVGIQIIHKSVGLVTESDVLLAAASGAVIIAFHVQVDSNAKLQAQQGGVDIRSYNVIYNAEEEVKMALEGLLEPEIKEEIVGRAVVMEMFKIPKQGFIAGSRVDEGIIHRGAKARLIRDDEVIHEGSITSLKRFKDDVKEIKDGMECGIGIDGAGKFKENDVIVTYEIQTIKRTLEV
ncbi:MAG TPA: translation initiation factor IF-2 [Candidatus Marinimicrobia bacterium]|jgi:translation initiation factor IF-2|nr:translation initiation factor IF-2 [Candidatus Neomarinimicrobiota bacterium]HIM27166.1 translation initiation factor IF-2 [Candidatus Neomarinimicrobiota bacterium]